MTTRGDLDVETMNVVFVGHVDHGKSTVVGRLLADTGALPTGKLEQIRAYCERNSLPFEYAFLIDALKDERRQNITIDSARVFFNSPRRRYIIIDAPGHIEFVKNMVTGAARAEAALLVIDAQEGVQENSRRHGNLLSLLGIHQVVVLVNKMDLVGYDRQRFESIQQDFSRFLDQVGLKPAGFIPVSAREGDHISRRSERMPWYQGPTVLEQLDAFEKASPPVDLPFRMPVQDVYRFTLFGDNRRIVAGTVASGRARVGDEIVFYPSGKRSTIQSIEAFTGEDARKLLSPDKGGGEGSRQDLDHDTRMLNLLSKAGVVAIEAGQASGFTLATQVYVKRGEMAVQSGEPPPHVSRRLRASLFWLGKEPLSLKKPYLIKLGTARMRFQVEKILRVIDAASLQDDTLRTQVDRHEMAECLLTLDQAIAFDHAGQLAETARFVVVDGYEIRGGGIVLEELPDTEAGERQGVFERNAHWIQGDISPEERAERYNQRACLVLITGKQGTGRKRLARALERRLFREGKTTYYLGMGSVVYGVDADIHSQAHPGSRREHIRRMAEIVNIFLDAGMILIITAVELTQEDLQLFQTIVDPARIETVWIGEPSTDIHTDLHLGDIEQTEQAVTVVKQALQEHGFIFRP